jgi:hypothetical protein
MANLSRGSWLKLYKDLLRASNEFKQYSYRHFAIRRVRDYFEVNRTQTNPETLQELYKEGQKTLFQLRRQTTIGQLYPLRPLIIETQQPKTL